MWIASRGDYYLKSFSCWDQYLAMAFAQLTYRESLRDIEVCLRSVRRKLYHMGFRGKEARSTPADGKTVRERWRYEAKRDVWDCINQPTKSHCLIVAEFELPAGNRLSRELVADTESLLIYHVQPDRSAQAKRSRIRRPGLEVRCLGDWPLPRRVFRDR